MQNFEQLGRALQEQGKGDQLRALAESPEGARLAGMIEPGALERATQAGDTEALKKLLSGVLRTEEGKRLAESIRRVMQD